MTSRTRGSKNDTHTQIIFSKNNVTQLHERSQPKSLAAGESLIQIRRKVVDCFDPY